MKWGAFVVLAACASAPPPAVTRTTHGDGDGDGGASPRRPSETPGRERRCIVEAMPYEPPPAERAPACQRASATIAAQIEPLVAKDFEPEHDGGKVHVAYPCDGLGPSSTIAELVYEGGGGHAGSLALWRARRIAGDRFAVRALVYQGASMAGPAAALPVRAVDGEVRFADADLDTIRAAISAEITEVFPPPPPNTIGLGRFSTSSHDFHALVRLVDGEHRVLERHYTGYAGSGSQAKYLGLAIARGPLAPMLALPPTARAIDADDRALFAARFVAAVPHFDDQFYWWVMESYVDAARFVGGPTTIPGLLGRLVVSDATDRSKVDARVNAIDALARITGWDARTGEPPDLDAAARAYLATCR